MLDRDLARVFELLHNEEAAVSLDDALDVGLLMAGEDQEAPGIGATASYSATNASSISVHSWLPHSQTSLIRSG